MILFTLVTNKSKQKAVWIYLGLTIFSLVFTWVYEQFSYGESSIYMRLMFLSPLVGTVSYILAQTKITWLRTRLSMLFWNSSLAIVASACLVRGIIEVSGRSTTIDQPYWWVAAFFTALSLGVSVFSLPKKTQVISQ